MGHFDAKVFNRDPGIAIVAGSVADTSTVLKFGANPTVGTTEETVWLQGGRYAYLSTATTLKVSSTSADDAAAGDNAQTVVIYGLDADYNAISETVTLNGLTAVDTVNEYLRVFRMVVDRVGATGVTSSNAGTIYAGTGTVTDGVPANVYALIGLTGTTGHGQTLMSLYTVPAGYTAFLRAIRVDVAGNRSATIQCYVRPYGKGFNLKNRWELYQSAVNICYEYPLMITEKSDIEFRAVSTLTDVPVTAKFDLVLIAND